MRTALRAHAAAPPFRILPALAPSKPNVRDVRGCTVMMMMVWVGILHIAAVWIWGHMA